VAALRAWRPRFVTRVRGDVTAALRPLLLELEARAAGCAGGAVLPSGGEGLVFVAPGGASQPVPVGAHGMSLPPGAAAALGGGVGAGLAGVGVGVGAAGKSQAPSGGGGGLRDLSSEHQSRLESLVSRYRAVGCPRNVAFTGLPQVLAALAATRVHEVEEESAQFALAVAVVPYPCEVYSVWVYAVALLPLAAS